MSESTERLLRYNSAVQNRLQEISQGIDHALVHSENQTNEPLVLLQHVVETWRGIEAYHETQLKREQAVQEFQEGKVAG